MLPPAVPAEIAALAITLSGETAGIVSDAESAISGLNASGQGGLAPLARLLLRTESIASSKVEGMQLDARQLARAEARNETGQNVAAGAAEILANIDAMQLAVEDANDADSVTVDKVLEIHRLLLQRSRPGAGGVVRSEQNRIGGNDYNPCGADYVPPPSEELERLLVDLCGFCNDDRLSPLVQAAIAHAQFETIHPFADGNGRTGRALVQVVLRRRGLAPSYVPPISVVLAADKARYVDGLVDYRTGRLDEWIGTFAVAAARAAGLASRFLVDVRALQGQWRSRLRVSGQVRADAAAWLLIDVLPAHPVITLPAAVAHVGRTTPAVNQGLAALERAGVLVPLSEGARNLAWEASGLLELLAGLEDETAELHGRHPPLGDHSTHGALVHTEELGERVHVDRVREPQLLVASHQRLLVARPRTRQHLAPFSVAFIGTSPRPPPPFVISPLLSTIPHCHPVARTSCTGREL